MIEPKRGKHNVSCMMIYPKCLCNSCQNDKDGCCGEGACGTIRCDDYIVDEPTKKGAANV